MAAGLPRLGGVTPAASFVLCLAYPAPEFKLGEYAP